MTTTQEINMEAHRRLEDDDIDCMEYAVRFADLRDQLIKEDWSPADGAVHLVDVVLRFSREKAISIVREALAKAREHPADVVEAAKALHGRHTSKESIALAEYILKP